MPPSFCEVALPVPVQSTFTYRIPDHLSAMAHPGSRVVVPFRNRSMVGVILEKSTPPGEGFRVREITEVLDSQPALTPALIRLGRWMSGYYLAPPGEVFRAMLPPQVEVRARRVYSIKTAGRSRLASLAGQTRRGDEDAVELSILQALADAEKPLPISQLGKLSAAGTPLTRLVRAGAVEAHEVSRHRKTRMLRVVAWNPAAQQKPSSGAESRLRELLTAVRGPMPLPRLLEQARVARSVVERLLALGKLIAWDEVPSEEPDPLLAEFTPPANTLNTGQQSALDEITVWLKERRFLTALLWGVTGSGKTEVYIGAIESALESGRAAIVLVPEIALTLWISRLLRARLGQRVAVLHSGLPTGERAHQWWRVRRGEARVVVGTRSAVFAPVENLGLIVVDEEHEPAYKQEETPRYHGRDTAVVRAREEGALALLGSATPSLESFHNARGGKYRLLRLQGRVENRPLAAVRVVDMREDFKARRNRPCALSQALHQAIAQRLDAGTQALVLINRRGFSWMALCRSCGAAVQCENCSISLTYHKRRGQMLCHYCGFHRPVPKTCPKCQSQYVYFFGEGIEQIEEILRSDFPRARVGRLDRDAVRSKRVFRQVLAAFDAGELDILAGTQMVAKGHDFQRVTLVGVVAADLTLSLPDFRAAERTFQLLTQVAGRAGRGELPGEVLVQTHYPQHYAIQCATRQDYEEFFEKELRYRRLMQYPPFAALATVIVRHRRMENAIRWSRAVAGFLEPQQTQGLRVLGPAAAPLARLKREYRFQFLLKAPRRAELNQALAACLKFCNEQEIPRGAVLVDVDPLSLM